MTRPIGPTPSVFRHPCQNLYTNPALTIADKVDVKLFEMCPNSVFELDEGI